MKITKDASTKILNYENIVVSGTQVNYYIVCKTKLWLFSHFIRMETNSENVKLGKIVHAEAFKREREENIDNNIAIDFIKKKAGIELHEIKKSMSLEKAEYWQLLYYLYYLKKFKGIENAKGIINYPTSKKTVKVELNEENEQKMENVIKEINEIVTMQTHPKKEKRKYCKKCAYYEFCWSD